MREVLSYYGSLLRRAWADSATTVREHMLAEAIAIAAGALTGLLQRPTDSWQSLVTSAVVYAVVFAVVCWALIFLGQLVWAPFRITKALRDRVHAFETEQDREFPVDVHVWSFEIRFRIADAPVRRDFLMLPDVLLVNRSTSRVNLGAELLVKDWRGLHFAYDPENAISDDLERVRQTLNIPANPPLLFPLTLDPQDAKRGSITFYLPPDKERFIATDPNLRGRRERFLDVKDYLSRKERRVTIGSEDGERVREFNVRDPH